MERVPVPVIIGGLSVIGIASFYAWRKKQKYEHSSHSRVEIKIHNAEIGHLIGRSGEKMKSLIQKSGAKIKFVLKDESYDYSVCIVEGDKTAVQKAQRIVYRILEEYAEMDINTCFIMKDDNNPFALMSKKFNESSQIEDAEHRVDSLQHSLVTDYLTDHTQKLDSSNNEGFIPVYVSAVATPESFWVQNIKTKEHIELDRLTEELCEYYEINPQLNVPPRHADVKTGYICATYSAEDNRWYRAEVAAVSLPNESDVNETLLDLYFLDYGVSSYQKIKNIRKLPQRFLTLKFQAIDCGLSHIKPKDQTWSEDSLSFFEDITHVGQWYVLMARIDYEDENGRPQLTLIDSNAKKDTNLADEMVNKGFAEYLLN